LPAQSSMTRPSRAKARVCRVSAGIAPP
jgi:hypothetical protein